MPALTDLPRLDPAEIDFHADTIDLERAARVYRDVGFIVVRGLLRRLVEPMMAEVRDAVAVAQRELPEATLMRYGWLTPSGGIYTDRVPPGFPPRRQLIVAPLSTHASPTLRACAEDARLHEIVRRLVPGDVELVGKGQCMYKEALHGNDAWLHQDAIYPGTEQYANVVSVFTYLVPTPIERGAIWLVPYSHRLGLLKHHESGPRAESIPTEVCDFSDAVPLAGEAGDTLLWSYNVVHGSKTNVTDVARPAVVTRYGTPIAVRAA
jgi:ectoine hydroxylase-related dioxygenase (phytanoyl-CoA dioxygenase family)